MKYLFLLTAFFAAIVTGCNDKDKQSTTGTTSDTLKTQADTLMADVMAGHDEGMSKYGKLNAMEKRVQYISDSLGKLSVKAVGPLKARMDSLLVDIRSAKKGMDDWMDRFNMDSAVNDLQARIRYLMDERVKVNKVRDDILMVLKKTDSLVRDRLD
jgi:hypothetical protein